MSKALIKVLGAYTNTLPALEDRQPCYVYDENKLYIGTPDGNKIIGDVELILPLVNKGDILVHNGSDLIRLPISDNGSILTCDNENENGVKWQAPTEPTEPTEIDLNFKIKSITNTTYTLLLDDVNSIIQCDNVSDISVTIPTFANVAFPIGCGISFMQANTGQVIIQGDVGVTILSSDDVYKTRVQNSVISITKLSDNIWLLAGDKDA
jgi:hypothetical protein